MIFLGEPVWYVLVDIGDIGLYASNREFSVARVNPGNVDLQPHLARIQHWLDAKSKDIHVST